MARFKARSERGDTLIFVVVLLPLLFVVLTLGIDLGGAIQAKSAQEEALVAAREAAMAPNVTLVAGTQADPGCWIAKEMTEAVRACGYDGAVDVYFYELPKDTVAPIDSPPDDRRIYAYEVVLSEDYTPIFASTIGIDNVPIKTAYVTSAMPYTDSAPYIWRPSWSAATQGRWTTSAGQDFSVATFTALQLTAMPTGIQHELAEALSELKN